MSSSYTEYGSGTCAWCDGIGFSFFGSYTSGSEHSFQCISCGQKYYAEGDYLEDVTISGGHGVLVCLTSSKDLPRLKRVHVQSTKVGQYAVFQQGTNHKVNQALAKRLAADSIWTYMVEYPRDIASSTAERRYDLTRASPKVTVLHGSPPMHADIVRVLTIPYEIKVDPFVDPQISNLDSMTVSPAVHDIGESEDIIF